MLGPSREPQDFSIALQTGAIDLSADRLRSETNPAFLPVVRCEECHPSRKFVLPRAIAKIPTRTSAADLRCDAGLRGWLRNSDAGQQGSMGASRMFFSSSS